MFRAHQDTKTSQLNCFSITFAIICAIFHFQLLATILCLIPLHSQFFPSLSLQLHRQKLRKQINNSRKINTLYILITFYKLLSTMSRKIFHALLIFHFTSTHLPSSSFPFFMKSFYNRIFLFSKARENRNGGRGRENVKLKGVKSVLINLNISFKHFIMSWQKQCVHGKLKK